MASRIEVSSKIEDARANILKKRIRAMGFSGEQITNVVLNDVVTIGFDLSEEQLQKIADMLVHPVTEAATINTHQAPEGFEFALEIGSLPGVKDNVGDTVKEGVEDLLDEEAPEFKGVHSSQVAYLSGQLTEKDVETIAEGLSNELIQRNHIKGVEQFYEDAGMDIVEPVVHLQTTPKADIVDLHGDDLELQRIGKLGIFDHEDEIKEGEFIERRQENIGDSLKLGDIVDKHDKFYQKVRRGPLALDLTYMNTIRDYFHKTENRNPTDVELESIAQTWSEHCKHTIFADPIDDITDGLYKHFIQRATNEIRKKKGDKDFCVSVFKDNSGAIIFDDKYLITDKVETHNSPSALDPFGGSITGIVGVNRDAIGFGLAAKPVINRYGFCFGDPNDTRPLYKGKNKTQKMLSPRRIMDGVIDGVNVGGNCSGIPTPQGFVFFDQRYKGKPLVFVGTVGLIEKEVAGKLAHEKAALTGDRIVMIGGRVGQDGIHGATFSSEALDEGSPATAVQIGDPITQKKESDALMEARDLGLFNSITDNGAGGLSCSVAEMAKECGGFTVDLEKVPLKYPNLEPWKIWISESQERMTLAVPEEKWDEFSNLMKRRGVEATTIGQFNDTNRAHVRFNQETVMDIEMDFLHNGLPQRPMKTTYTKPKYCEPYIPKPENLTDSFHSMLGRLNIASYEFISQQYDHEVQGGSVLKPLQGRGLVNADATATRPVLDSRKAVITSQGINPTYSDIDTYAMAASAIDTAVRNAIAAGANPDHLALLDNFCWCSSDDPERLGQLKAAVQACYDTAVVYETPFISGKDSMFNDFKGYDENGKPTKISIPPTLLVSSISVVDDAEKTVSLDAKMVGDLVYVLGETNDELGASEYYALLSEQKNESIISNSVPQVDAERNNKLYRSLAKGIDEELVASAQSIHRGGLAVALAKTAMGGKLGMDISLENLPGDASRDDFALYSESQGRIVVTIAPEDKYKFEQLMDSSSFAQIGQVILNEFTVKGKDGSEIIKTNVEDLLKPYKQTFEGY